MFLIYWPYLAIVMSIALVLALLVVSMAGGLCRARTQCLPERDLNTYLPDHAQDDNLISYGVDELDPVEASAPPHRDVEMQPFPYEGTFEPGLPYNLDQSMSPEGRQDFEV